MPRTKRPAPEKPAAGDEYNLSGDFRGATINIKSTLIGAAEARELEALPPEPGDPPYQGLNSFDEEDAPRFFGREMLTARLAARLGEDNFLAVIGDSGSGKSSLVRAGLIPALRAGVRLADGALPPIGSKSWERQIFTPTAHPLDALGEALGIPAQTLTGDPGGLVKALSQRKTRVLLVVDQFEEVFTQCRSEDERRIFIDQLLAGIEADALHVLILLRADFYARLAAYDRLRERVARRQEFIGAMNRDELFRAIVQPAALGNWKIQDGLVEVMLDDIGAEPGALPLLSHALLETWLRRRGRTMTLSSYTEAGGVRGAIAKTAEAVFNRRLSAEQQPIARMIFLHLAELDEDAKDTRRRASFSELITRSTDPVTIEAVLSILTDARLVITGSAGPGGEKSVEVAHEALIREWPTLRQWLAQDREGLILHRQLTEDTAGWLRLGRDSGALYRGKRLAEAQVWAAAHADQLSLDEAAYLEASQHAVDAELRREREGQRLRRVFLPLAGVGALAALIAVFFLSGLYVRFLTPARMDGIFNIAVAEFSGPGESGAKLSGWVGNQLTAELAAEANIQVWQDGPVLRRQNVTIGVVQGGTPEERSASAAAMAERLNAQMIVFGQVDESVQPARLTLEFWLAPQMGYRFEEIQGGYRSAPILLADARNPGLEVEADVNRQASTLAWVSLGLARASFGDPAAALQAFERAAQLSADIPAVQFFLGRESLFLSDRDADRRDALTNQAEGAFQKALSLDSQYARAAVGLGSVYLASARRLAAGEDAPEASLLAAEDFARQALQTYESVAAMPPDPAGSPVHLAAQLGAGTTLRLQGELAYRLGRSDEAGERVQQSVAVLEGILAPLEAEGQARYLAQSVQTLATAYQWLGFLEETAGASESSRAWYERALAAYDRCITMGQASTDRILKDDIAGKLCTPYRDELQQQLGAPEAGG
ncbi:MAG: hypothetical protein HY835_00700 [Anaerolineae bacterium]|nr:hypothetical protein [Anaerolineae bacterium]